MRYKLIITWESETQMHKALKMAEAALKTLLDNHNHPDDEIGKAQLAQIRTALATAEREEDEA